MPEFSPFWVTVPLALVMTILGYVGIRHSRQSGLTQKAITAPVDSIDVADDGNFNVPERQVIVPPVVGEGQPLNVRVVLIENKGGSPGLFVQATNLDSVAVESAAVVVINILCWNGKKFTTSSDIHGSGVTCRALEIGKVTLQPDEPTNVQLIHSQSHRLELNGQSQHGSEPAYRMTRAGIRQISYRVTGADGRQAEGVVCLRWDGPESEPSPCDCPHYQVGERSSEASGSTAAAVTSKDWQDQSDRFSNTGY